MQRNETGGLLQKQKNAKILQHGHGSFISASGLVSPGNFFLAVDAT